MNSPAKSNNEKGMRKNPKSNTSILSEYIVSSYSSDVKNSNIDEVKIKKSKKNSNMLKIIHGFEDISELNWQDDALCAQTDPEAFFPEKGGSTRDAKKVCNSCSVKSQCLEYALSNDERFGIWGGLSERERRKLRKKVL